MTSVPTPIPVLSTPVPPALAQTSFAATLPSELLTLIMEFRYSNEVFTGEGGDLSAPTLVCKAWHSPAQRSLFAAVSLQTPFEMVAFTALVTRNAMLALSVRGLWLQNFGTATQLAKLLKLLPGITRLDFHLEKLYLPEDFDEEADDDERDSPTFDRAAFNARKFRDFSGLAEIKHLSNVTMICMRTNYFDREFRELRQILDATPNVTLLTIGDEYNPKASDTPLLPSDKPPINVPHLQSFYLQSKIICRDLINFNLLSDATFDQVTDLHLEFDLRPLDSGPTSSFCGGHLGKNVKKLACGMGFKFPSVGRLIAACPNLEILKTESAFRQAVLPPSLHTVVYDAEWARNSKWLLEKDELGPVKGGWGNVKSFDFKGREPNRKVIKYFKECGVTLVNTDSGAAKYQAHWRDKINGVKRYD